MNVTIRKFEEKDINDKLKWINDERNNKFLHYDIPLEYDKTLDWYNKNKDRSDRFDAVIEYNGIPVGIIGLLNIDIKSRKAELYITLGNHELKGKGIAKTAIKLLLKYAFATLDLNKVYLLTEKENIIAQKLFEGIGFRKEGLLHDDTINKGVLVSRYVYGYYKKDFECPQKSREKYCNPTEIQRLKYCLNENALYIKREDLFPLSFGGNKARKGILYFNDIDKGGYDCVVTYGSNSSNHCRIVASLAATRNLPCHIISPDEEGKKTNNSKIVMLLGACITYCNVTEVSNTIDRKLKELKDNGYNPYFIMGGGHGTIGTQAYVDCYDEICCQEEQSNIKYDYIFIASGTGTTQAGLVCGQIMNNDFAKKIIGISIARKNPNGKKIVEESIRDYFNEKGYIGEFRNGLVSFIDDYTLGGYGDYNIEILKLITTIYKTDGVPLDPTYTGKAFWGMEKYIKANDIVDKNILFIHTGGTPIFFDILEQL